jgi:hypothetical protein
MAEGSQSKSRKRARSSLADRAGSGNPVKTKNGIITTGMRNTLNHSATEEDSITVVNPDQPANLITVASPQTVSPDLDSALQASIADEQPVGGLLGYVQESEKRQKRNHGKTASSDSPNASALPSTYKPAVNSLIRATNGLSSPSSAALTPSLRQSSRFQPSREESSRVGGQQTALIDTLPKMKQRQIFGLISGIQGGIDHLQKQLNLLQAAMGIEIDED